MATVSATEAKQRFAAVLDQAQREPVLIRRNQRGVAILISVQDFERLNAGRWAELNRLAEIASTQAKASGLTEEALKEILADR